LGVGGIGKKRGKKRGRGLKKMLQRIFDREKKQKNSGKKGLCLQNVERSGGSILERKKIVRGGV